MKRTSSSEADTPADDMLPEYQLDYREARPNRFASTDAKRHTVVLDDDVAEVFTTSEAVNKALRALLEAVPLVAARKRPTRK